MYKRIELYTHLRYHASYTLRQHSENPLRDTWQTELRDSEQTTRRGFLASGGQRTVKQSIGQLNIICFVLISVAARRTKHVYSERQPCHSMQPSISNDCVRGRARECESIGKIPNNPDDE